MKMAEKLKELRISKNLEIRDVLILLKKEGFEVSEEEMRRHEEDEKDLDADTFLAVLLAVAMPPLVETVLVNALSAPVLCLDPCQLSSFIGPT